MECQPVGLQRTTTAPISPEWNPGQMDLSLAAHQSSPSIAGSIGLAKNGYFLEGCGYAARACMKTVEGKPFRRQNSYSP
jgi:hypothetical protein